MCTVKVVKANDEHKWRCVAINWEEAGENSVCKVCPGNCSCNLHSHIPYRLKVMKHVKREHWMTC